MALPGKVDLNDVVVFIAVAETGGFTAAATRLGVATAKISVEISRLEEKLGVSLFRRTTRKVAMTDAGQSLYEECRPLVQQLSEALDQAASRQEQLAGTLRISTTVDHATLSLAPALAEFSRQYPELSIDLHTSDRVVSLIDDAIDVSIRLGWLKDSSLRAVKLGDFSQYLVGSASYFTGKKRPREPYDLAALSWVSLSLLPAPLTWTFVGPGGETQVIHAKSRFRTDSPGALRTLIQEGLGISVLDQFNARDAIASERLIHLLPEWTLPSAGIYAVYASEKKVPVKVRRFIDFYRHYLTSHKL